MCRLWTYWVFSGYYTMHHGNNKLADRRCGLAVCAENTWRPTACLVSLGNKNARDGMEYMDVLYGHRGVVRYCWYVNSEKIYNLRSVAFVEYAWAHTHSTCLCVQRTY